MQPPCFLQAVLKGLNPKDLNLNQSQINAPLTINF